MRIHATVAAASLLVLVSARARAADPAAAQMLFDDGMRLMTSHQYAQACPKFEESQRLDPGLGTLFHFADCEEHIGRTASAWAAFLEVASEAKAQGQSARELAAHNRAAALEPTLARLTIDPGAERGTPSLELLRDGATMGSAQWSLAVPVDPGAHVIEARAPGKTPWATTVNVVAGARDAITVPGLADAVSSTTTTAAELDQRSSGKGQRVAGLVLGAAGLAGLGIGGYFGAVSWIRHDDAGSHCGANGCDASGVSLRDDARRDGNAATVSFVAGGALLLAGIITYVTAPRSSASDARRSADARSVFLIGPGGAVVRGVW